MTIRKLLLPTLITAALSAPGAFAQSTDASGQDHAQHHAPAAKKDAKAEAAKADSTKAGSPDVGKGQDASRKPAKKDARSAAGEQPDEPEEDGR